MSRVKRGLVTRRRHKRLLKQAKGFWGQRNNIYRRAHETLRRAWAFAYKGRRLKKRDMRGLFITRISAAVKMHNMSYSVFIHKIHKAGIALNRKMMSQLAVYDPAAFQALVQVIQS
ncbi:MAG TPA: 50S ribosomal protein L20 [Candidatus Bathyarchaeia archaeon]|nr:50S ribosomal protein L20 [Candidatus Bathyarchaeia archaeon]